MQVQPAKMTSWPLLSNVLNVVLGPITAMGRVKKLPVEKVEAEPP